ncbi:MAG: hypothetical protein ACI9G1_005729 [Pirellulaceae bacterium]|jgi:hypothetical protein
MPKGLVTQSFCILLRKPVSLDLVRAALQRFGDCRDVPAAESWAFGGPSLNYTLEPNSKGSVVVDVVDKPWPDTMGHPDDEPMIFGAWSLGHFGPFTYPGSLERTQEQCWMWEDGTSTAAEHQAFVRVRVGYSFGDNHDAAIMPDDYAALAELNYITTMAAALLSLPGALCYFNPNGETLLDERLFEEGRAYAEQTEIPPLDLWSNVRLYNIDEQWVLMDTVGNEQFEGKDCEACFLTENYDLQEVNAFLRNLSLLSMNHPDAIEEGMDLDGPGRVKWRLELADSACPAPRPVLRWLPVDGSEFPREKLQSTGDEDTEGESESSESSDSV